jgi:hypothetical protein
MPERGSQRALSYEEQARRMSSEELQSELGKQNVALASLGVKTPISVMIYGARMYGRSYEDVRDSEGGTPATPMNCLMALVHAEDELLSLPRMEFERLASTVSRVAITTGALLEKEGSFRWPAKFTRSPQWEPKDTINE